MNKYFVLSAAALVISLAVGCQNCGYKTAHSSRYQSLVGTTRLASPQTNCRYNTCNAYNTCSNSCNTCETQLLANNGQLCSNAYAQGYQDGLAQQYSEENASANVSLLDATQQQTAQSETPLRWRSVTEEEQRYANSSVNTASSGIASALGNPAFGSPAPAPVDPQYPPRYPNSSPRAAAGVASALDTPGYPPRSRAPLYPPRYPNSSPRAAAGVASALDTPGYPSRGGAPQYPNQYPNSSPRAAAGVNSALTPGYNSPNSALGSDPMRWRRVTEEEQRYPNSSRRAMPGTPSAMGNPGYGSANSQYPGYGSANSQYPNVPYSGSETEPLTVPVYPENNVEAPQTPGNATPEIDPEALPSINSQNGMF